MGGEHSEPDLGYKENRINPSWSIVNSEIKRFECLSCQTSTVSKEISLRK